MHILGILYIIVEMTNNLGTKFRGFFQLSFIMVQIDNLDTNLGCLVYVFYIMSEVSNFLENRIYLMAWR
jgi:hypothetical protein